jgi:hypothetical protein
MISVRNNVSYLILFDSFTREVNRIVSPWIAFALLTYQLLLVAEVFQLALVSAFVTSLLLTDTVSCSQTCGRCRVHLTVPRRPSEIFGNCGLILLRMLR